MFIDIDKVLLDEIIKRTDDKSVHQIVDKALKFYLRKIQLAELASLRGKMPWEGTLETVQLSVSA